MTQSWTPAPSPPATKGPRSRVRGSWGGGLPGLGLGLLWRAETAALARREAAAGRLGFVEVIAESMPTVLPAGLEAVRRSAAAIVPHGVGLGLGGASRPDRRRLARLAEVADACGAPLVSEHVAFVRAGRAEAGHLLPVPRTRAALDIVVANAREAAAALPVPLALEPIATLVDWPGAELSEVAFLSELLDRAPVGLVLDLANLHVNAANRRRAGVTGVDTDPAAVLDALPLERVAYVHVAGGRVVDGRFHDTHAHPLWPEVEVLVEELWSRHEPPGLLLERDDHFPGNAAVRDELDRLRAAAARGRARRHADGLGPSRESPPSHRPTPGPTTDDHPSDRSGWRVRRLLGREQAVFLGALTGGAVPPGLDPADMRALAEVLVRKRERAVAKLSPDLAATPAFGRRFAAWAATHPLRRGGAPADAARFVRASSPTDRTAPACLAVTTAEVRTGRRPRIRLRRTPQGLVAAVRLGRHTWAKSPA
jgi:uncharacterized protein